MSKVKTKPYNIDLKKMIAKTDNTIRRQYCETLMQWMRKDSNEKPALWEESYKSKLYQIKV